MGRFASTVDLDHVKVRAGCKLAAKVMTFSNVVRVQEATPIWLPMHQKS